MLMQIKTGAFKHYILLTAQHTQTHDSTVRLCARSANCEDIQRYLFYILLSGSEFILRNIFGLIFWFTSEKEIHFDFQQIQIRIPINRDFKFQSKHQLIEYRNGLF